MKLELLILAILLLSGLFIVLYKYSQSPQPIFIYTYDQPKKSFNSNESIQSHRDYSKDPRDYSRNKVIGYQEYQPYFPQSLGISGNTFIDYINSGYYSYYPGYNYTYDPYFYNWNNIENKPENIKKSIKVIQLTLHLF